ncbi:unnamed protein product [Pleuronectes platessa]|uniref:Uncharacterized protein n=1 Tax=Pleuronectes platessa TaxID=8262 RepID=A0A9N7VTK7_PLEPL|nr:unnamed protein product [Pleuronectes platessa]
MRLTIRQLWKKSICSQAQIQADRSHPQDQAVRSQPQDQAVRSQPQDQAVRSQPQDKAVSSQQVAYGCQKMTKLNGLFAQEMSHPALATNVIRMKPGPTRIAVTHPRFHPENHSGLQ